jgi:hypothetical protein
MIGPLAGTMSDPSRLDVWPMNSGCMKKLLKGSKESLRVSGETAFLAV